MSEHVTSPVGALPDLSERAESAIKRGEPLVLLTEREAQQYGENRRFRWIHPRLQVHDRVDAVSDPFEPMPYRSADIVLTTAGLALDMRPLLGATD